RADLADDGVAGTQVEAADLAGRDVDVVRAGQVGGVRGAQEAEAVLENLQHAVAGDLFAAFRVLLEQGEDDVLLARTGHVFQTSLVGHVQQFGNRLLLEFGQIHRNDVDVRRGRKAPGALLAAPRRRRLDRSILSGGVRRRRLGGQRGTRCRPECNTGFGAPSSPRQRKSPADGGAFFTTLRCWRRGRRPAATWTGRRPWWPRRCRS